MHIAVCGTGMVGRALAGRLDGLGHDVVLGTRDLDATVASTRTGFDGVRAADWLAEHPDVELRPFADLGSGFDLIVNATNGLGSVDVFRSIDPETLAGTVVLDVGNRLDHSGDGPTVLATEGEPSLAELLQEAAPQARVVKALNTMTAVLMVEPQRFAGGAHTVFVSGDDAAAKATVVDLLRSFGWDDIVDLGPLRTARATEMVMPLWLSVMTALELPPDGFQFRLVR